MKELIKITYKDAFLSLVRQNGKLTFTKTSKTGLNLNMTREERQLLLNIVVNIMPSQHLVNLRDINYNAKKIKHFFDKKTGWHLFYELKDNQLVVPEETIQVMLNQMFNRQTINVYSGITTDKEKLIKRIVRFGKTTAIVLVASAISFAVTSQKDEMGKNTKPENDYSLSYDEIEDLVEQQKNLIDLEILQNRLKNEIPENTINISQIIEIATEKDPNQQEPNTSQTSIDNIKIPEEPTLIPNENTPIDIDTNRDNQVEKPTDNIQPTENENPANDQDQSINIDNIAEEPTDNTQPTENEDPANNQDQSIIIDEEEYPENMSYDNLNDNQKAALIVKTIQQNSNLTDEEKKFLTSVPQFFIDGAKYFDMDHVINNMKNLKIIYYSEPNGNIKGEYEPFGTNKNTISIYGASSFNDADKQILSHEFLHSFTRYQSETTAYGSGLAEMINVILNNEYFGTTYSNIVEDEYFGTLSIGVNPNEYDKSYHWNRRYAYLLTELVGTDVLRQYHATADPTIIENTLLEICNEDIKAANIVIGLDYQIWNYSNNVGEKIFEEIMADIDADMDFFYEIKFDKKIDDDNYASFLLDTDGFKNRLREEFNISESKQLNIKVNKEKIYFNSALKDDTYIVNISYPNYVICSTEDIISKYPEYLTKIDELPTTEDGKFIISEDVNISYDLTKNNTNHYSL